MLHIIKKTALTIVAAAISVATLAQDMQTGYFNDEYTYRFLMNPAMSNSDNFVAMPALGNLNIEMNSNIGLKSIFYNVNGKTTTFMHPDIKASEVMGNLKDMNRISENNRINILGGGFKAFGGYNTINISARTDLNVRVPKAIFSFLKEGVANQTYDLSGFGANGIGYGEISLGHSRDITPEIRVGGNLKFLVGIASVDANLSEAYLQLHDDSWNIRAKADLHASLKGMHFGTKISKSTGKPYVDDLDGDFKPLNGFGMAIDLGAVYAPKALPDFKFSLAVVDLGFINWSEDLYATTDGEEFQSSVLNFNVDKDSPNSFDNQWEKVKDDLAQIYELRSDGNVGNRTQALHATINAGVQYIFPLYRKLNFGLLNTTKIAGKYTITDFRLSANVAPCKLFSATVSGVAGTNGWGFGWLANLHTKGFNFFLGQDHTFFKLAKPGIPTNSSWGATLGMNFLF